MYYYTIYKITNVLNGKFYIGKHKTKNLDDGYLGSGTLIKYAVKKYGKESFTKEYLEIFDQSWKMNLAERILVVIDSEVSYNFSIGGLAGFSGCSHKQESKLQTALKLQGHPSLCKPRTAETRLKISIARTGKSYGPRPKYKKWSEEDKNAQSMRMIGKKRGPYKKWSLEDRIAQSKRLTGKKKKIKGEID